MKTIRPNNWNIIIESRGMRFSVQLPEVGPDNSLKFVFQSIDAKFGKYKVLCISPNTKPNPGAFKYDQG